MMCNLNCTTGWTAIPDRLVALGWLRREGPNLRMARLTPLDFEAVPKDPLTERRIIIFSTCAQSHLPA